MITDSITDQELAQAKQIAPFATFQEQAAAIVAEAGNIVVTDATQVSLIKRSKELRLKAKHTRCALENLRKEKVEGLVRDTKAINSDANRIKEVLESLEARLLENEQFAERAEAARIAATKAARETELKPVSVVDVSLLNLGEMSDEQYSALLADSKTAHAARVEAKAKADAAAAAAAEAEAAERERVRVENLRLQREAAEREKAIAAERAANEERLAKEAADAERREIQAQIQKEREESAERERIANARAIEAQRIADEATRAQAAKAVEERKAREKLTDELAAQKAAEEKAAADNLAAEQSAAAAPDREKLETLALMFIAIPLPEMATDAGRAALRQISGTIAEMVAYIQRKGAAL